MKEWVKVLKAADAAAHWHINQRRKGAGQEPYINHLIEVASFIAEATEGRDPHLVIAALLHDAIEDQKISRELIAEQFGDDVASLVVESVDFERAPIASTAAIWYLDMELSDLDAPFQACYRVCVNTRHPLCRRFEAA